MKSLNRRRRTRIIWLFFLTAIIFSLLIHRLVKLQAVEHNQLSELAQWQHTGNIQINPLRGSIYDANGTTLAFSVTRPSVYAHPDMVKEPDQAALYLSLALNMDREKLAKALKSKSSFVWIQRKIDPDLAEKVKKLELPGVFVKEEATGKRFYPKKRIASHILGYTGIDDQGLEGVEASYNDLLSGIPGTMEAEMDERGRIIPGARMKYTPSTPGNDIYLTIDETIQFIAEKELEKQVNEYNADGGTVIVYNPKNGDILALANHPDFLPEDPYSSSQQNIRNDAVCDSYEPGSTFKVILACAALDSGKVTTKDRFFSGTSIQVGDYSLRNAADGLVSSGTETVEGMITYSFNTAAASIGLKIGKDTLYDYIEKFGFGVLTGIDLPGEHEGIVIPAKYWKPINLATISYGQGIAVTPIQLVQAYGAIANDGIMMKPRIVKKIVTAEGKVEEKEPAVIGQVMKPETTHEILKILSSVCEDGTGKNARIDGYTVGGKTGTANVVKNGVYVDENYIASFVGVVPIENPELVILIKINNPKGMAWGGTVAAPVFKNVGSQVLWRLGVQPTREIKKEMASQ